MALLEAGTVVTAPLVTEVVPLERWEHAFSASRGGDAVKEVLRAVSAVIFDCDGTLVDSEPLSRRVWEVLLGARGYTLTDEDYAAVLGRPYRARARVLRRAGRAARGRRWSGPTSRARCSS